LILHIIGELGTDGSTYMAMEFAGPTIYSLGMEERMTICNMAVEGGAKNGIIAADSITESYVRSRTDKPFKSPQSDPDAQYALVREYDVSTILPTVARPHSPGNRANAADCADTKVDRVYIGSCTGGKTIDFIAAATILFNQKVAVETYIVPATTDVDSDLDSQKVGGKTLREIFRRAGCKIGPASCAACLGGPDDTFGRANAPITVVATTNRNFPGRMGHMQAQVFLASPLTAAASAIKGHVADPREFVQAKKAIGLAE
jgi:3-isopropylmalate/(R)-2-methylmalate dehydratase large subunit